MTQIVSRRNHSPPFSIQATKGRYTYMRLRRNTQVRNEFTVNTLLPNAAETKTKKKHIEANTRSREEETTAKIENLISNMHNLPKLENFPLREMRGGKKHKTQLLFHFPYSPNSWAHLKTENHSKISNSSPKRKRSESSQSAFKSTRRHKTTTRVPENAPSTESHRPKHRFGLFFFCSFFLNKQFLEREH